jgi:hypothetical protein
MATISDAFSFAAENYARGQLDEAENISRQILAADPNHDGAWRLLGMIALHSGSFGSALGIAPLGIRRSASQFLPGQLGSNAFYRTNGWLEVSRYFDSESGANKLVFQKASRAREMQR